MAQSNGSSREANAAQLLTGLAPGSPALSGFEVIPGELVGGAQTSLAGTITLSSAAPMGGCQVTLSSNRPDVLAVSPTVTVEEGSLSSQVAIQIMGVSEPVAGELTASLGTQICRATVVVYPVDQQVKTDNVAPPVNTLPARTGVPTTPSPTGTSKPSPTRAAGPLATQVEGWWPSCPQSLVAAFLAVSPFVPFVAVIMTVAIYLARSIYGPVQIAQPVKASPELAGLGFALVAGLAGALVVRYLVHGTSADMADGSTFSELLGRIRDIDARLEVATATAGANQGSQIGQHRAQLLRSQIGSELARAGTHWILAAGYMSVWRLVHRTEELLLTLEPTDDLIAAALYDELRLTGSVIDNAGDLIAKLRRAVPELDPSAQAFLSQPPADNSPGTENPRVDDAGAAARAALRDVRQTLNEFRDESWAALARSRNHLVIMIATTGVVTYLLLAAALSVRSSDSPSDPMADSILAATVLYLVGAIVGLFNRLYTEANSDKDVSDYGLTLARLSLTPILSGLAGIGGVLVVALLITGVGGTVLSPNAVGRALPSLADIFNLRANQFGIVIAATFGLAPSLLIGALQSQADKYTQAIKSTGASATPNS